jgi:hypothetical protein
MSPEELTFIVADNPDFVLLTNKKYYMSKHSYARYIKNGTKIEIGVHDGQYRIFVAGYKTDDKKRMARQRDYTELLKKLDCSLDILDYFFVCEFPLSDPNLLEDVKRTQDTIIKWVKHNKPQMYGSRESNPQVALRNALNQMRGGP